jgi:magnesium transporter
LVYIGPEQSFAAYVEVFEYSGETSTKTVYTNPLAFTPEPATDKNQWIVVYGVHDVDTVKHISAHFSLHHLLVEDILNTQQRPNAELYDDLFFSSFKMVSWDNEASVVSEEHVSVILKGNTVLLFQERPGDVFDDIRSRIESGKGLLRSKRSDYLFYRILDACVDQYFTICEQLHERIELLEAEIIQAPNAGVMPRLINKRKQLLLLRSTALPLRDHVALATRSERDVITKETLPYLRDLSTHVREVIELIDLERDSVGALIELFMSASNQQLSQIMRVLTVISTIFIPLTFIVGVYGMNFDRMPELHYAWGYPAIWGVMIAVTLGLLVYFKRKRWL